MNTTHITPINEEPFEVIETKETKNSSEFRAADLKVKIDQEWIDKQLKVIKSKEKAGKATFVADKHVCTHATKEHLRKTLLDGGFVVKDSLNSYGVKTLIITW